MLKELNSKRSDFKVSEPHTVHPNFSKFEGAVASQNPFIIFLCKEGFGGTGGKS